MYVYFSTCLRNKDTDNHWDAEVRDDVLRECMKFGHTYHIHVDKNSQVCIRSDTRVLYSYVYHIVYRVTYM